jgi:hypothetical protein
MSNKDIAQFFELVRIGDQVEIRGERDADTARVFGGDPAAVPDSAAAQPAAGQ